MLAKLLADGIHHTLGVMVDKRRELQRSLLKVNFDSLFLPLTSVLTMNARSWEQICE
jgi:hypothetical protein